MDPVPLRLDLRGGGPLTYRGNLAEALLLSAMSMVGRRCRGKLGWQPRGRHGVRGAAAWLLLDAEVVWRPWILVPEPRSVGTGVLWRIAVLGRMVGARCPA